MQVQDIWNCIRDQPGRDHYDLLVANGEWEVLLTPRNNTMDYSEKTRHKLEEILGSWGTVEAKLVER